MKPVFFLPSVFSLGFFGGLALSFFSSIIAKLYISCLSLYFIAVIIDTFIRKEILRVKILAVITIFLTHIVYGLGFIQGLFTKKFKSRLND